MRRLGIAVALALIVAGLAVTMLGIDLAVTEGRPTQLSDRWEPQYVVVDHRR